MSPRPRIRAITTVATAVVAGLVVAGCGGASDEIGGSNAMASPSGGKQTDRKSVV